MGNKYVTEEIRLTKQQESCVNYVGDKRKNLAINAVPGGGKSVVLMARALKFLKEAKEENKKNSIIVFTYNKVLARVLKEWMEIKKEDEEYITITTSFEFLSSVYKKMPGFKLGNGAYDAVKSNALKSVIDSSVEKYNTDKYKRWGSKFWQDEFAWMRKMDIFDDEDKVYYLDLNRTGRGREHPMNVVDRRVAFEMFCDYQKILRRKKAYEDSYNGNEMFLYMSHNVDKIPDSCKYEHILVDEAQDQSLAKLKVIKALSTKDVTICFDRDQRIYEYKWPLRIVFPDIQSKVLSISLRCASQISEFAECLKKNDFSENDEEDGIYEENDKYCDRHARSNEKPHVIECNNESEEKKIVVSLVRNWMENYPNDTIGILVHTKSAITKIQSWLTSENIQYQYTDSKDSEHFSIMQPGVKVLTMHNSKGLEFSRVILPQFYNGMIPFNWALEKSKVEELINERNVAYVAMTRAILELYIVYNGRKSQFIKEIDEELYISEKTNDVIREVKDAKIKECKNINIPEEEMSNLYVKKHNRTDTSGWYL